MVVLVVGRRLLLLGFRIMLIGVGRYLDGWLLIGIDDR